VRAADIFVDAVDKSLKNLHHTRAFRCTRICGWRNAAPLTTSRLIELHAVEVLYGQDEATFAFGGARREPAIVKPAARTNLPWMIADQKMVATILQADRIPGWRIVRIILLVLMAPQWSGELGGGREGLSPFDAKSRGLAE